MNPCFITFEGIEGSGKSTQIKKSKDYFENKGYDVIQTVEPGGTDFGQKIRRILTDPAISFAHKYTEILLFTADRLEHIEKTIKPALQKGKIVLCDRYIDSTIAYQHGGRGLPLAEVKSLINYVKLVPDKTILLDIEPEEGLRRAKNRADLDRFEQEELSFHLKVKEAYLKTAEIEKQRFHVVNAEGLDEEEVFAKIQPVLNDIYALR